MRSPSSRSNRARASSTPAVEGQRADEPERAGEELALVAGQAVVGLGGRVARDEAVAAQLAQDRVDRAGHALVGPRQEADERDVQHARVELLRAVVLGERPPLRVVARARRPRGGSRRATLLQRSSGAVEPEPLGEPDAHGRRRPRPSPWSTCSAGAARAPPRCRRRARARSSRRARRSRASAARGRGSTRPERARRPDTRRRPPRRRRRAGTARTRRCRPAPAASPRSRAAGRARTRSAGARRRRRT